MSSNIASNYIYSAAYQILAILTPFLTTPYLSRVLMADGIGRISFVASIVHHFTLFASLGIYTYAQREISYSQDNRAERSRVFWNIKIFAIINVLIVYCIFLVLTYFFAQENYLLYLIYGINIFNTALDVSWLFSGMGEFKLLALRAMAVRTMNTALIFIFVKNKSDIPIYLLLGVSCTISGHFLLYKSLSKYIDKPDLKKINPFEGLKTILILFIPSIATEIYTVLDKTMIGLFTIDSFENGYYESALKISKIPMMLILAMSSVMMPRMGYLFHKNDTQKIHEYLYMTYRFVFFLGVPLCLGLIGISDNFVSCFFGNGYIKTAGLMKITSFLVIAIGINNVSGTLYFIPAKKTEHI